jgi:hypothetical protein
MRDKLIIHLPKQSTPTKGRSMALTSIGHIRAEMAAVYRQARNGTIDPATGTKFVFILVALAKLIETGELEQRLEKLEAMAAGGQRP